MAPPLATATAVGHTRYLSVDGSDQTAPNPNATATATVKKGGNPRNGSEPDIPWIETSARNLAKCQSGGR